MDSQIVRDSIERKGRYLSQVRSLSRANMKADIAAHENGSMVNQNGSFERIQGQPCKELTVKVTGAGDRGVHAPDSDNQVDPAQVTPVGQDLQHQCSGLSSIDPTTVDVDPDISILQGNQRQFFTSAITLTGGQQSRGGGKSVPSTNNKQSPNKAHSSLTHRPRKLLKGRKNMRNGANFAAFGPLELKHLFDTYNAGKHKEVTVNGGRHHGNNGTKKLAALANKSSLPRLTHSNQKGEDQNTSRKPRNSLQKNSSQLRSSSQLPSTSCLHSTPFPSSLIYLAQPGSVPTGSLHPQLQGSVGHPQLTTSITSTTLPAAPSMTSPFPPAMTTSSQLPKEIHANNQQPQVPKKAISKFQRVGNVEAKASYGQGANITTPAETHHNSIMNTASSVQVSSQKKKKTYREKYLDEMQVKVNDAAERFVIRQMKNGSNKRKSKQQKESYTEESRPLIVTVGRKQESLDVDQDNFQVVVIGRHGSEMVHENLQFKDMLRQNSQSQLMMHRDRYYYNSAKVESRAQSPGQRSQNGSNALELTLQAATMDNRRQNKKDNRLDNTGLVHDGDRLDTEHLDGDSKKLVPSKLIRSLPAGKVASGSKSQQQKSNKKDNTILEVVNANTMKDIDGRFQQNNIDQHFIETNIMANDPINFDALLAQDLASKQQRAHIMSSFKHNGNNEPHSVPVNDTISPRDFHSSQQTTNRSKKGMVAGGARALGIDIQKSEQNKKKHNALASGQKSSIAKNTANLLSNAHQQQQKYKLQNGKYVSQQGASLASNKAAGDSRHMNLAPPIGSTGNQGTTKAASQTSNQGIVNENSFTRGDNGQDGSHSHLRSNDPNLRTPMGLLAEQSDNKTRNNYSIRKGLDQATTPVINHSNFETLGSQYEFSQTKRLSDMQGLITHQTTSAVMSDCDEIHRQMSNNPYQRNNNTELCSQLQDNHLQIVECSDRLQGPSADLDQLSRPDDVVQIRKQDKSHKKSSRQGLNKIKSKGVLSHNQVVRDLDGPSGSVMKEETRLLRGTDSNDHFLVSEQEIDSKSNVEQIQAQNLITIIKSFELSNSNENEECTGEDDDLTKNFNVIDKQLADLSTDIATRIKQSKIQLIKSLQQAERQGSKKRSQKQGKELELDAAIDSLRFQSSAQAREKSQSEMAKLQLQIVNKPQPSESKSAGKSKHRKFVRGTKNGAAEKEKDSAGRKNEEQIILTIHNPIKQQSEQMRRKEHFDLLKKSRALNKAPIVASTLQHKSDFTNSPRMLTSNGNDKSIKWVNNHPLNNTESKEPRPLEMTSKQNSATKSHHEKKRNSQPTCTEPRDEKAKLEMPMKQSSVDEVKETMTNPSGKRSLPGIGEVTVAKSEQPKNTPVTIDSKKRKDALQQTQPVPKKEKLLFNHVMNKFNGVYDQLDSKLDELNQQVDTLRFYQSKYGRMVMYQNSCGRSIRTGRSILYQGRQMANGGRSVATGRTGGMHLNGYRDLNADNDNDTMMSNHNYNSSTMRGVNGDGFASPRGQTYNKTASILQTNPRRKMESTLKGHYKSRGSNYNDHNTGGRISILGGSNLNSAAKDKQFGLMMNQKKKVVQFNLPEIE